MDIPADLPPVLAQDIRENYRRDDSLMIVSPDVGGVVHTHSTYATAWAARGEPIPCVLTMIADEFGFTREDLDAFGAESQRRANATIGRALQLVIRNVGGGRPGDAPRCRLESSPLAA